MSREEYINVVVLNEESGMPAAVFKMLPYVLDINFQARDMDSITGEFAIGSEKSKAQMQHELNFLKKDRQFWVIYEPAAPQYKDIRREYEQQQAEKSIVHILCDICHKPFTEEGTEYKCNCISKYHKTCLKNYFINLKPVGSQPGQKDFRCPSCEGAIQLRDIMNREEYRKYKADAKIKTSRARRSNSIHGYDTSIVNKLDRTRRSASKETKVSGLKEEEHYCVLCGASFMLHKSIEEIFYHHAYDNRCNGGYVHKKCLREVLSVYFWHRYERYSEEKILLLTKAETRALGNNWACPQCSRAFSEDQLQQLVDPREWTRQIKMREERERVAKSRFVEERKDRVIIYKEGKIIL
eukprot:TRINITY_DN9442_c0_g9_i1.p1 TRINITY_DN9442_c0_g9~~TRINITY_DN9442_c0_g9_i1.p1  ORF type:complete len:353 (-),score=90.18 TRINITY_DN9442_c0_g9_i1:187-1245(-)